MKRLRIYESAHRDVEYVYEDINGRKRPIPFDPKTAPEHWAVRQRILDKAKRGTYYND
jgi:glycine cleavage system aminomethyltransferase T